ncbi:MAG: drug/metabolite exporter YedA [Acidobacteriota bacterium]
MATPTNPTAKSTVSKDAAPSLPAVLAAFGAVYFIWGSTYLGIRFAIETIPPFIMAGLRFLSAGVVLFAVARWQGAGRPAGSHWRSAAIIGVLLLVSGNGVLTWAEQYVASGVAALIVATVPLWMVVIDAFAPGGSRPGPAIILGLVLGLAGIAILIGPAELGGAPVDLVGALAICLASISWAFGSIYSRSAPQSPSTLQNVGMQMLIGGALMLVGGYAFGERLDPAAVSERSAWALAYLSLFGGVVSYSAYVWLLKVSTPAKVATYAYVNPVVAVVLGWALAGEELGPRVFLATAAVVGAVILLTLSRDRASKTAAESSSKPVLDEGAA